jgi:hypothetical protein
LIDFSNRIVNTLRKWIATLPSDFDEKENPKLHKRLKFFVKELQDIADHMSDKESAQLYTKYIELLSQTLQVHTTFTPLCDNVCVLCTSIGVCVIV